MTFTANCDVRDLPIATASMSLGRAWVHELDTKLRAAAAAGFKGIEIFWEDLLYAARRYDAEATESTGQAILQAAAWTRQLCDDLDLEILVLQPLMNYEGLIDRAEHAKQIEKAKLFFQVVKILGTDIVQVPSQMSKIGTTGNLRAIVEDMKELAVLGQQQDPPVRVAYECMAWGAHIDTWEAAFEVVQQANEPNLGLVLDTYQIVGRVWADPTADDMRVPHADEALHATLERMVSTPGLKERIYYVQLSDAERLSPPLTPSHPYWDDTMLPRMQWSRNARLFPCESLGCLPLESFGRTLFDAMGWRGWVSLELFSRTTSSPEPAVPQTHAQRGIESWRKYLESIGQL